MIKHMPFPNASYRDQINISNAAVWCWNIVNNTVKIKTATFATVPVLPLLPRPVESSWNMKTPQVKFQQNRTCFPWEPCSLRQPRPAQQLIGVQLFGIDPSCVFWCTGPECDVISLLRQKRQARSPPPGHRPLTWTGGTVCNHNWMA